MEEQIETWLALLAKVKDKVADGLPKKALKLLRQAKDFPDPKQDILRMVARWGVNERRKMEGLLTEDEFRVENNTITKEFLLFLIEQEQKLKTEFDQLINSSEPIAGTAVEPPSYEGKAQILLLYAQEDLPHWKTLQKHFFMFRRDEGLQLVDIHADVPLAATDTLAYQQKMVTAAHMVLCVVTPNTMTLPIFELAEQAAAATKLIPLRFEEVSLENTPFHRGIRGLPADDRFVAEWDNENAALSEMTKQLKPVFERLKNAAND